MTPDPAEPVLRWLRGAVLLLVVWWTLRLGFTGGRWCFLDYVNLPFHEAGHVLLGWAGRTIYFLGGTLGQLAVPAALGVYFLVWTRSPFGGALCLFWLGESLNNVAIYMADARDLELPLVGGGEHDWTEIFYTFGLLSETSVARVSTLTHLAALLLMLAGLAWGTVFVLPLPWRDRVRESLTRRFPWLDPAL